MRIFGFDCDVKGGNMVEKISQKIVDKVKQLLTRDIDAGVIAEVLDIPKRVVVHISEGKYMTKDVSKKDSQKIHRLWAEGKTITQISLDTGWSYTTIRRNLMDVKKLKKHLTEEEMETIFKYHAQGIKVFQIAEEFHVHPATVYRVIKKQKRK